MTTYRVTLVDHESKPLHAFDCAPNQSVLEAAQRAGIALLAGCGHGACRTCLVRLRAGRIHMPDGTALTTDLLDAHLVLPCVMTISSDVVVQVPEHDGPWDPELILPWTD